MQLSFDLAPKPVYRPLNNQQRLVLELLYGHWTTVGEAMERIGVYALSQRVSEISRMGYVIEKTWRDLPSGKRVRAYRIAP